MNTERERNADTLSGVGWIVFGAIVVVLSLMMDRREHLGATFLTGPGFVPMLLGGALCVLGLVLILRSRRRHVLAFFEPPENISNGSVLAALALMLVYSIGLIGWMPFWLATVLFITSFVTVFNLPAGNARGTALVVLKAAITGAVATAVIVLVFEEVFLVRLP